MNRLFTIIFSGFLMSCSASASIYDFSVLNANGELESLEKYRGFVVIFVNVASYCGYTDWNYNELRELNDKYYERGLRIAAFPCNQFGQQEPDDVRRIVQFVHKNYNFQPDLYEKIKVNGPEADPIWTFLKSDNNSDDHSDIPWNFSKFLVNRRGQVVGRFSHKINPSQFEHQIRAILDEKQEL